MEKNALKIPCNAMPFICEADYSVTLGQMIHADRIVPFHVAIYLLRGSMEIIEDGIRYELLPHRLFFLKSGVHHWGEKPFEEGSAWYYAHFYCQEPDARMQELPRNVYYDTKVCLDPNENEKYITLPKLTDCERMRQIQKDFEKMIEAHVHGTFRRLRCGYGRFFWSVPKTRRVILCKMYMCGNCGSTFRHMV